MDKNISFIILEICKKYNIPYTSINLNANEFINDAKRIGEIVLEIESLSDELDCILMRHKVGVFTKEQIQKDLEILHSIDHDLLNLATKIKTEKRDALQ